MSPEYQEFLAVTGALGKLVVLSIIIERGLAFIFEHEWFVKFTTNEIPDPSDSSKTIRKSKFPALKGFFALAVSIGICVAYKFDILAALFAKGQSDMLGILITGVVAAGGSAGAIAIFQGFLNINKDSRDALLAAKKAQAESTKEVAEAEAAEAKSKAESAKLVAESASIEAKAKADAAKSIAEAQALEAKARQAKAEAELAEVEAKKKALGK